MRRLLAIILLLFAEVASAASLQWEAGVVDEDHAPATGYRIYYGSASGQYTLNADAGNALQWPIPESWPAGVYYFAATAYNATGESGYSNEVQWIKAETPSIQPASGGQWRLSWVEEPIMAVSVPQNIQVAMDARFSAQTVTISSYAVGSDANRALIVLCYNNYSDAGREVTGVTFGGSALTNIEQSPNTSWGLCSAWILVNPSNTTADIVATWAAGHSTDEGKIVAAFWLYGVDQADAIPSGDVKSGYSSASSHTISPTNLASGDLAVGLVSVDFSSASCSITTGTEIHTDFCSPWTDAGAAYNTGTGTVSIVISHANVGTGWIGFRVKAASGGGASVVPVLMRQYRARR